MVSKTAAELTVLFPTVACEVGTSATDVLLFVCVGRTVEVVALFALPPGLVPGALLGFTLGANPLRTMVLWNVYARFQHYMSGGDNEKLHKLYNTIATMLARHLLVSSLAVGKSRLSMEGRVSGGFFRVCYM